MKNPILIDQIEIPAFDSEEIFHVYQIFLNNLKLFRTDRNMERYIRMAQINYRSRNKIGTLSNPMTLYKYSFDDDHLIGEHTTRDCFRKMNELECANIPLHVPFYLLSIQLEGKEANIDTGRGNRFFLWDDEEYCMKCILIEWVKATEGYTDRHCGFPYLEFDGEPAMWSVFESSLSTDLAYASNVFSSKEITFD